MRSIAEADHPCWPPVALTGGRRIEDGQAFDVVVVGAGLAGCSTALRLAERRPELTVALLEASSPGAGASGHGTGLLGPRLGPPVEVARRRFGDAAAKRLYRQSVRGVAAVLALADRYAPAAVTPCQGQLMVGFTDAERSTVLRRAYAYRDLGLDVDLVVAGTRAAPATPTAPAVHFPSAAGADPKALTVGLASGAAKLGVLVSEQSRVLGLGRGPGGHTNVQTGDATVTARAVVVAVDSAATDLLPPSGDLLHLEVCASATAELPADLIAELGGPSAPHILSASALGAYRRLTSDGRLVIGGGPASVWPPIGRGQLSRRRRQAWSWQRAWLDRLHSDLSKIDIEHHWSGRITMTRDGLPVLGRANVCGEVWHAGGWNGHGLAATVMAGARLADSVLRETVPVAADEPHLLWRPPRRWVLAQRPARPIVQAYLSTTTSRACSRRPPGDLMGVPAHRPEPVHP